MFDLLCRQGSPDFVKYLRAYEGIARPPGETIEISCELVNGIRKDRGRLAVFDLRRQDVLNWLAACQFKVPLIEDLVFENTTDKCFMIGLADYPARERGCRIKIYNEYGTSTSVAGGEEHAQRLFSLLNIPGHEFQKDRALFRKIKIGAVEWGQSRRAIVKIYFGNFSSEQLFGRFSGVLSPQDLSCYDRLRKNGMLPRIFHFCVRYSRQGRSLKVEFNCQTRRIGPYLDMFDPKREASKLFLELHRLSPGLRMEFLSLQGVPDRKVQFYFKVF